MMVVELRANSRMRGLTSLESATYTSGSISCTSSRMRRSCTGLRNDHSSDTAIARTPSASSVADPLARAVLVERDDDLAVAVEPLDDLEGVALGEQVVVLVLLEHVLELVRRAPEVAALDVHDEDRVAVPLRGQEADVGHLARSPAR